MITRLQNLYLTFTTVVNRFTNKDEDDTKNKTHITHNISCTKRYLQTHLHIRVQTKYRWCLLVFECMARLSNS